MRNLPLMHRPTITRQCGPCNLCCNVMGVPSIAKPANTPCTHLTRGRCGIYAERPGECEEFACAWLQGVLPNDLRPDRVHAVATAGKHLTPGDMIVFHIPPSHRGAHTKGKLAAWIREAVRRGGSIMIACGDERIPMGPVTVAWKRMVEKLGAKGAADQSGNGP